MNTNSIIENFKEIVTNNSNYREEKLRVSLPEKVGATTYTAPNIEIIDIELEQNILQSGSSDLPSMPGEGW